MLTKKNFKLLDHVYAIYVLFFKNTFSLSDNNYPLTRPWTPSTASRVSFDVISVRPLALLSTVTFVTYIYVKPVWGNISPINPKITV